MTTVAKNGGTTPKLIIEGLSKQYGAVTALEPTHLTVPTGEFLTLLGPSGSGKTTLLQMICGLVEPSSGRILIDGRDQTQTPVHQRDIGLVFQHYALFPHLTVAENIEFPLRMRALSASEIKQRVKDVLKMVQLDHLAARFPRELSGGQQQRVALARSFVYQPSIILMDEPLGALDKKLREHMQIEIKQLHRETGATIIYVTHDQEEALALSDRICLMNHARIEQLGSPHEIYAHPATAFAADFIGISNIFRGRVDNSNGETRLATRHGHFRLPTGASFSGAEAAIVIRPEQISLGGGNGNTVVGRVTDAVYAGSETRLIVDLDEGETVIVRLPPGQPTPGYGERATLGWNPDAAVLVP
ncbi:ABC transporter ATP-binding protein [Microvirga guangxiensis]|uniref:Putative spermidine/putrescine transport system ATP-binding protein n=1 Tax=Microvirga guangxiensis TaxID=549386 RepID=A0A1G5BLJ7_9HYPH|nr:ABC transporter ATP-binding protein [Microvirga guangxiensis]SCX91082.1 putative spermidine/putrescine transport system ATP-binding protein [Microvirga guangxiensis]